MIADGIHIQSDSRFNQILKLIFVIRILFAFFVFDVLDDDAFLLVF